MPDDLEEVELLRRPHQGPVRGEESRIESLGERHYGSWAGRRGDA